MIKDFTLRNCEKNLLLSGIESEKTSSKKLIFKDL